MMFGDEEEVNTFGKRPGEPLSASSPLRFRHTCYIYADPPKSVAPPTPLPFVVGSGLKPLKNANKLPIAGPPKEEPEKPVDGPHLVDAVSGKVHPLLAASPTVIGRSSTCAVIVKDRDVSGRHIIFYCRDGAVEAEDVSSRGAFINGNRMPKGVGDGPPIRTKLEDGDKIVLSKLGGAGFVFAAGPKP
mmetsp:Transcript_17408/g.49446  ORF Transcript_17408/g.49446 Transcript_17408/m.49446 type:complete len:188 (+) Transcript_17408:107-670(+)